MIRAWNATTVRRLGVALLTVGLLTLGGCATKKVSGTI